jgi:hypothetical protein
LRLRKEQSFDPKFAIQKWNRLLEQQKPLSSREIFHMGLDIARIQTNFKGEKRDVLDSVKLDDGVNDPIWITAHPNAYKPKEIWLTVQNDEELGSIEIHRHKKFWLFNSYKMYLDVKQRFSQLAQTELPKNIVSLPLPLSEEEMLRVGKNLWETFLRTPQP